MSGFDLKDVVRRSNSARRVLNDDIARDLLRWLENAELASVAVSKAEEFRRSEVTLLGKACPEPLFDFLMARLGFEALQVTTRGIGFEAHHLKLLRHEAVLRVGELKPELPEEEAPVRPAPRTAPFSAPAPVVEPQVLLPREGFVLWQLCDPAQVREVRSRVPDRQVERRKLLKQLEERPVRYLPIATRGHVERIRQLATDFPNFSGVIETLSRAVSLRARIRAPLSLPPLLLQGVPGLGKTVFAKKLAQALGFQIEVRSFAEMTAGFVLTGNTAAWSESQPGLIARMLIQMPDDVVPLLVLDELDKVQKSNHPADKPLLGLLEPHSARRFRDEHLDIELNIEPLSYLFTSNDLSRIKPEVRSRLRECEVYSPTANQMPAIVRSVDQVLREEDEGLAKSFKQLDPAVIDSLGAIEPRRLRAVLLDAYARVADRDHQIEGFLQLKVEDLVPVHTTNAAASRADVVSGKPNWQEIAMLIIDMRTVWTVH